MKNSTSYRLATVLLACTILAACSDDDDDTSPVTEVPTTNGFVFRTDAPTDYTRVDRMGMPAIATALIASKDAYNASNPPDDIAQVYVPEILNSLTFLHNALDSQLEGLGLSPCTVVGDGTGTCATAAVPLILPDTIKIDTATDAGFPNGRQLPDPVIDITLAVALLDLTGTPAPHAAGDLVGVLNPTENDKPFQAAFPFLATPHQ